MKASDGREPERSETQPDRGRLVEGIAAVARPPRRLFRRFVLLTERMLHPVRRRRSERAIRALSPPTKLLFICLGNICRSPYAAARFERLASHAADTAVWTERLVASAGFVLPGREPPATAVEVAKSLGLDLRDHRSQVFDHDMIAGSDLIVVMTSKQKRDIRSRYGRDDVIHLGDLDPEPIPQRDIPDPLDQPEETFRQVYDRIDRALGHMNGLLYEGKVARFRGTSQ